MSEHTNDSVKQRQGRTRVSVAIIASLGFFFVTVVTLSVLTTIGVVYALVAALPATAIVACSIMMVDAVAECFAAIVEAIVAVFAAIAEAVGAVIAAILAALAAVFSIFGG